MALETRPYGNTGDMMTARAGSSANQCLERRSVSDLTMTPKQLPGRPSMALVTAVNLVDKRYKEVQYHLMTHTHPATCQARPHLSCIQNSDSHLSPLCSYCGTPAARSRP